MVLVAFWYLQLHVTRITVVHMRDKVPITITLRISRKDRAALRRLERKAKMPYSDICRTAISEYVCRMLNGISVEDARATVKAMKP